MSIYEQQQERKRAEHYYGPWEKTLEAILVAQGARECADVEYEQQWLEPYRVLWSGKRLNGLMI